MKVRLHRVFEKQLRKMSSKNQKQAKERIILFSRDSFAPILNNHPLHGKYAGCRSVNVTGDLRAIYQEIDSDTAYFITIGTHDDLYS